MSPKPTPKVPQQQLGRYAIYEEIASGGMATVHLARLAGPLGFSRVVAAKRLHPHLVGDADFKRMFLDEARLAARIRHPNVVPTLDVLVNENEIILVMEYVHGESLMMLRRTARERKEPVPLPITTAILVSVLHGLHAAHEARSENGEALHIVHRDVSPQNILVGADGAVRVLDFGVAKAIQSQPDARPGTLKGKFSYMAPEVVRGEAATRAADIFAAGVVFWELVTGRKLFGGANEHERMLKVLAENYPGPSQVNADLPAVIDRIVMRALHPDVASRYTSALEMAVDIETYLASASQRIVGEWVNRLAGHSLEGRAELLQQIEVSHIGSVFAPTFDHETNETIRTLDVGVSSRAPRRMNAAGALNSLGGLKLALAAALATLAVGVVVLLRPKSADAPPALESAVAAGRPILVPTPAPAASTPPSLLPQDPAPSVARSPQVLGSANAPVRSRPSARAPSSRPGPTGAPGTGNAKTFLPDDL